MINNGEQRRTNNPKISVVVPALNEEKYLPNLLNSLKKQTYPPTDFELVVVVDSRTTDQTEKMARDFGARIITGTKPGVGWSRKIGFDSASGQIIASTDSDSILPTDWLAKIDQLMTDPAGACVAGVDWPIEGGVFLWLGFYLYHLFIKTNYFLGKPLPWGNNFAMRADVYAKTGGFDPDLKTSEDWQLALKAKAVMDKKAKFLYLESLPVKISTRKYQRRGIFLKYIIDGIYNYWNVVILGKAKSAQMMNIR
jgi:glycosyltransferase involved in cell wall biosynthesis